MLSPALRAIAQMTDPVFLGVVLHSLGWSVLAFILLAVGVFYGGHAVLADQGWMGWLAGAAGVVGSAVLSLWLFLPLATVIASLFAARIAAAVERRHYPGLPPARPASLAAQSLDALVLGLLVLAMQAIALVATLIPPHVTGLALGWLIASWAVGRGLFVPVAMLRMDRGAALRLYRAQRTRVVFQGALMTAAGMVPGLNLLAPVLGVAAMVHVLHGATSQVRVVPPAPVV
jgi:CysZ protein